jgi:hypothetical protein
MSRSLSQSLSQSLFRSHSVAALVLLAAVVPARAQQAAHQAAPQPAPQAAQQPLDHAHYVLHWAQLVDQYGFAQPMEAARILTPVDWKFEGVVAWGAANGCPPEMVKTAGSAMSKDTLSGFAFFPVHTWQWFDDPRQQQTAARGGSQPSIQRGCAAEPLVGAVDYIRRAILPKWRPNARVVATEPMPKLAQALTEQAQSAAAGMLQNHMYNWVRVDAGRVKIAYQINGHPVEEWIMATVLAIAKPGLGGGRGNWYNATASRVFAYRTPAGKLDSEPALFATMLGSIRSNPQWQAKMTQVLQNTGKIERKGAADRARIRAGMQQAQGDASNARYEQISAAEDKQSEEFAQTQRGLEWYTDPTTHEKVEMSYGYRHTYTNGNGEYILNDDPNFNPSKYFNGTWTPMERNQQ